ncbi:hypothetical protein AVEN_190496-1 [Araneus ventricosus]|uniref:Uncharacterized protein n=1 Tax=Araneus ventricosus TaxID=182803 RepID=A0A4Y2JF65_ARAVE|nr:hypothetical protein AVEN_190496-1 [Araneus ventricosus]
MNADRTSLFGASFEVTNLFKYEFLPFFTQSFKWEFLWEWKLGIVVKLNSLEENEMERDQGRKLDIELQECDGLTGNSILGKTREPALRNEGATKIRPFPRREVLNVCNHELRACAARI